MSAQRYRKKPMVIDAIQFTDKAAIVWLLDQNADFETVAPGHLILHTLEGPMNVRRDDWIIKGIAGEFYPCKPEIFAATYDQEQAA